jgi:hypothetical protein
MNWKERVCTNSKKSVRDLWVVVLLSFYFCSACCFSFVILIVDAIERALLLTSGMQYNSLIVVFDIDDGAHYIECCAA